MVHKLMRLGLDGAKMACLHIDYNIFCFSNWLAWATNARQWPNGHPPFEPPPPRNCLAREQRVEPKLPAHSIIFHVIYKSATTGATSTTCSRCGGSCAVTNMCVVGTLSAASEHEAKLCYSLEGIRERSMETTPGSTMSAWIRAHREHRLCSADDTSHDK